MDKITVETVQFRLNKQANEKEFLLAAELSQEEFFNIQPGFIDRSLSKDTEGLWTDRLRWNLLRHAQLAAQKMDKHPANQAFVEKIDPASVTMHYSEELKSWKQQ